MKIMQKIAIGAMAALPSLGAMAADESTTTYEVPAYVDKSLNTLTSGAQAWMDKIVPWAAGIMVIGLALIGLYLVWRVFRRVFG